MKKGLIITNGYSSSPSELNQSARMREELAKLGVDASIERNNRFRALLSSSCEVEFRGEYDFCIYLDKDKYLAQMLEKSGMRLFNCSKAIDSCDDKFQTYLDLSGCGVKIPKTLGGFLCYTAGATFSEEGLDEIERQLGYPVVVKECFGSLGKGVYLAEDRGELKALADQLIYRPHLFQQFISESSGKDVRVICVGGEVAAAMKRISSGDFRSNLELGGRGERVEADAEMKRIAAIVSERLRLDYCGIDLLLGKEGCVLCEVNSNAFFGGIEKITGVNVGKVYAEYIVEQVYGGR